MGAFLRHAVALPITALLFAAGGAAADSVSEDDLPETPSFQFMAFSERESISGRRYRKLSIMRFQSQARVGGRDVQVQFKAPGGKRSFASFELRF